MVPINLSFQAHLCCCCLKNHIQKSGGTCSLVNRVIFIESLYIDSPLEMLCKFFVPIRDPGGLEGMINSIFNFWTN